MSDWIDLQCGLCRTKLRIRAAYAHMKGRCPDCGFRIPPPRPLPAAEQPALRLTLTSDEPLGLLPEDEEWPEPALHAEPETFTGVYSVSGLAPAAISPGAMEPLDKPSSTTVADASDVFRLVDDVQPRDARPAVPPPWQVNPPPVLSRSSRPFPNWRRQPRPSSIRFSWMNLSRSLHRRPRAWL